MDRESAPKWIRGVIPYYVCSDLLIWAQAEYDMDPGSLLGVMRGQAWASRKRGPESEKPGLEALVRVINAAVPQTAGLRWEAWAVMLWAGGSIGWHDHNQAELATVTYLQMPPGSGALCFEAGKARPQPGDLLAFGGMLRHAVEPFTALAGGPAAEPRISVAVNFHLDKLIIGG